ncbi:MAG: hypothetical protein GKR90_05715 [Pseudomonadales bacterium]|nr:hypothetical protein [Pseudomonadales bacterium]
MATLQIDEFYRDATKILVNLFEIFPRPVTIYAEDISGPDEPDEYGVHSKRYQACFATMMWLAEEGYTRYNDVIRQDALDQVVLTGKCFSALLSPQSEVDSSVEEQTLPASVLAEKSTRIYRMRSALESRSSEQIAEAFRPLLDRMSG